MKFFCLFSQNNTTIRCETQEPQHIKHFDSNLKRLDTSHGPPTRIETHCFDVEIKLAIYTKLQVAAQEYTSTLMENIEQKIKALQAKKKNHEPTNKTDTLYIFL